MFRELLATSEREMLLSDDLMSEFYFLSFFRGTYLLVGSRSSAGGQII